MVRLPERPGRAASADLAARRSGLAAAVASGMWTADPPPTEMLLGGVRALRFEPPGEPVACVLHMHGGAFRVGCPEQVAPFAAALASRCGVTVICPAYRLAPEHPFPAGLNDAWSVFLALREAGEQRIALSGDSAGGGLAASVAALARDGDQALIGLILLSAWLDLTVSAHAFADNAATDPLFSRASAEEAADLYLQGMTADDRLASPAFADVNGFAPTFISVGSGEVLIDDARALYARMRAASIDVSLDIVPGMHHVAVTRGLDLPGAVETFEAIVAFIERVTG